MNETMDKAGATASLLCAIHCVAVPVLFALLPVAGLAWLDNPAVDWWFLLAAVVFVVIAHPAGYAKHRRCTPPVLAGSGLVAIVLAIKLWGQSPAHHYGVALGGLLVAASHFLNRHLCKSCQHGCKH